MTHIAIHEKLDGKVVDWLEHVTSELGETRDDAYENLLRGVLCILRFQSIRRARP